jgi:predicted nucleic acid-binding protein
MAQAAMHRGAKPIDLVIAAAAEAGGLAVLHHDGEHDRIARVTRQPVEWVAAHGSLDR